MIARITRTFSIASLLAWAFLAFVAPAAAQTGAPPAPAAEPDKVAQFLQLLDDPAVKQWLSEQIKAPTLPAASPPAAAQTPPADGMQPSMVSSSLDRIKAHVERLIAAIPGLPQKFERARNILSLEFADRGIWGIALLVAFFIAVGFGLSYIALKLTRPLRLWTIAMPRTTPQGRVKKLGGRFLFVMIMIGAFILGSAGAFSLFEWPPLLREIVLAYLSAAIVIWTVRMLLRFALLPPQLEVENSWQVRALPMRDKRAAHWYIWISIITAVFVLVGATFALLPTLGFGNVDILALSLPVDLVLLGLGLAAVWLRPRLVVREGQEPGRISHAAASWALTAYFILLFIVRTSGAYVLFWFAVAAVALPAAIITAHRAVHFVLRAPEDETAPPIPAVTVAVIDRGIRMIFIIIAAYLLARVWGLDMASMENSDPTTTLILKGILNTIVIVLAADFGWSIIKALIERKLGVEQAPASGEEEAAHALDPQQARVRTLLPIIQNIIFAVIIVMTVLMILSSVGIQIGPLIAGAGVVGVAVGFGAQTVVKDVISGVFYLLDDAFRVGEYISSGKYMGTVESFSLRSIKLRHHRGPLFTIPFGELGAVQNQSRDWVTDKFNITVGYDTDVEFARKLIKRIGLELAEDPEFKPWVIEPIKMQGVQEFGDYGIVLRMKVTTKPGGAFGMKRKFYVRVQQVFKEQGIELPFPTVHVQGPPQGEPHGAGQPGQVTPEVEAAVAQAHTSRRKRKAAEAAAAAE